MAMFRFVLIPACAWGTFIEGSGQPLPVPFTAELLRQLRPADGDARVGRSMGEEVANRFQMRPMPSEMPDRLHLVVKKGGSMLCNADVIFHGTPGLSFVDMFLHLANYISIATYFEASFAWSRPDTYHLAWSTYFGNALGLATPVCQKLGNPQELDHAHDWIQKLWMAHSAYTVRLQRPIISQLWDLRPDTAAMINTSLLHAGIGNNTKFIGVDLPGMDLHSNFGSEDESTTVSSSSSVVAYIRKMMKDMNINVLYAVRRDDGVNRDSQKVSLLQRHFGTRTQVRTLSLVDSEDGGISPSSSSSVLTVLEALRRSHAFVGSSASSVSKLVYRLRSYNSTSLVVHPDNLEITPFVE